MKADSLIPPITPETTLGNAKKWLGIVRFGESGTVIQLQDDCEYRVLEIINNPKIVKGILGPYYRKYLLEYVPIDQKDLLTSVKASLIQSCVKRRIGLKGVLSELQTIELLEEIAKKGYEVGLFISHINHLLRKHDIQPLIDLEFLIRTSKNFSVIVFSEIDISHESYNFLTDKCSFLYDQVVRYPLYSEKDVRQFITYYSLLWKLSLPEKVTKEIVTACGGYLWLAHQIVRDLRDNPSLTLKEAFSSDLLLRKLETVWNKFTESEKIILRKTYFGSLQKKDTLMHEYEYLRSIKILNIVEDSARLGIPLLAQVIEREQRLKTFHSIENRVFIGKKEITKDLTPKEKDVLKVLFASKKKIVSRDTIAQTIWGSNWEEKYSDWAIDRLVHRLRKKLKMLGIDEKLLKTVKKKGFIFG